jgi:iron complex transport system substrate-binding protein
MALVMLLLVGTLAACGDDDSSDEPTPTTEAAGTASTPAAPTATTEAASSSPATSPDAEQAASPDTGTRTITHASGTTDITGVPQRIVVLEWTYAEDLLALGVQPVGVADVAGYKKWVNVEPALSGDVTDVGTRQEPSLESIAALEPDLIIGVQFRHEQIYKDLSDIAPTLLFDPYPTDPAVSQLDEMRTTLLAIADAVARPDEGQQVLDDMDAAFAEAKTKLDDAGKGGAPFALVQAFTSQDAPQMRLFTTTSMASSIMESIGLKNAWEGEFDQYGYNTVGVEALTTIPDANFFYVVQSDDDVFATAWKDNPVWTSLNFVKEGRTYALGGDTWLFGGPLSAQVLVDKVVAALAG